jgi:hypothetical protein
VGLHSGRGIFGVLGFLAFIWWRRPCEAAYFPLRRHLRRGYRFAELQNSDEDTGRVFML